MIDRLLDIVTRDGSMNTFVTHPEAHLQAAGTNARIEWYPGVHHGFAFPERPVYDKPAAERHWERLFAPFARTLT